VGADNPDHLPYFGTKEQVLTWQGDCTAKHPTFAVRCLLSGHPHRVSHFSRGVTDDGQMWQLHWWLPRAQHEAPDLRADQIPEWAEVI
jgi:hypothetical protein